MATRDFQASWVDVYSRTGGWSKTHSSHPIRTGGGSGTDWHTFIGIPNAVRDALNSSSTATTLSMRINFTQASSEIDVGYANHASSRSVGSTGLPQYAYTETWRGIGTGWQEYGMSNFFRPRVADGSIRNVILYSGNGQFNNTAIGIGQSAHVRFRVTGTWDEPETASRFSVSFPRANWFVGDTGTISITRDNSSFHHRVHVTLGSRSQTISNDVGTSVSWTPPHAWADQIRESRSSSGTVRVETFRGGTKIGENISSVTFGVPNDPVFRPSLSAIEASIEGNGVDSSLGKFIQGISRIRGRFTSTATHGAYVVTERIYFGDFRWGGSNGVSPILDSSNNVTVTYEAIDSRNMTTTATRDVTVHAYHPPRITTFTARRGAETNVDIVRNGNYTGLNGDNTINIRVRRRPIGGTFTTVNEENTSSTLAGTATFGTTFTSTGNIENISYEFELVITDRFNTSNPTISNETVGTVGYPMSWGRQGTAVGKAYEESIGGALQIGGDVFAEGEFNINGIRFDAVQSILPSGNGSREYWLNVPTGKYLCEPDTFPSQPRTWGFVDVAVYDSTVLVNFEGIGTGEFPLWRMNFNASSSTAQINRWRQVYEEGTPIPEESWTDLPLQSGYTHRGDTRCQFRRNALNQVEFRGMLNMGGSSSHFGTLPSGYRPSVTKAFSVYSDRNPERIWITNDGRVGQSIRDGAVTHIGLDGVVFSIGS